MIGRNSRQICQILLINLNFGKTQLFWLPAFTKTGIGRTQLVHFYQDYSSVSKTSTPNTMFMKPCALFQRKRAISRVQTYQRVDLWGFPNVPSLFSFGIYQSRIFNCSLSWMHVFLPCMKNVEHDYMVNCTSPVECGMHMQCQSKRPQANCDCIAGEAESGYRICTPCTYL